MKADGSLPGFRGPENIWRRFVNNRQPVLWAATGCRVIAELACSFRVRSAGSSETHQNRGQIPRMEFSLVAVRIDADFHPCRVEDARGARLQVKT